MQQYCIDETQFQWIIDNGEWIIWVAEAIELSTKAENEEKRKEISDLKFEI